MCLDTVWQQHSELGRSKHQGSIRNLHVLDAGSLQIWTLGRLTVGTIPSVKPPVSLHNMEIKQTGMCTKINYANANKQTKKKTMLENRTFDFQSQSLSLRSVTTEKLWTENVKRRRFIHSELQSSAGGHQGQNQLEHSRGLIVTSLLQVSLLTLKQTIYTYIFIYIRVYRIHPDSGCKIEDNRPKEKK